MSNFFRASFSETQLPKSTDQLQRRIQMRFFFTQQICYALNKMICIFFHLNHRDNFGTLKHLSNKIHFFNN